MHVSRFRRGLEAGPHPAPARASRSSRWAGSSAASAPGSWATCKRRGGWETPAFASSPWAASTSTRLACADFETLTNSPALQADVCTLTPERLRAAWGEFAPDVVFHSSPCVGLSGLVAEEKAASPHYQALNNLTVIGMELLCTTWHSPPAADRHGERASLLRGKPAAGTCSTQSRRCSLATATASTRARTTAASSEASPSTVAASCWSRAIQAR